MKHIVTMQDISCVGKCSLTVALPVLSAMGIETSVIPTAVLSTHSGFPGFTFRDLTVDIRSILDHWKKENFLFDAVYSGYLASSKQIRLVQELFSDFTRPDAICLVDPVMADEGRMYTGFPADYADEMLQLCCHADVIVPNLTEACFLAGLPYREDPSEEYVKDVLKKLADCGPKKIIMTGAGFRKNELGAISYNAIENTFYTYTNERFPAVCYGTGDLFASSLLGALVRGQKIEDAMAVAVDFVHCCVRETLHDPQAHRYGVNFESAIPYLVQRISSF